MKNSQGIGNSFMRGTTLMLGIMLVAPMLTAPTQAMTMMHRAGARRPSVSEFGLGPRTSAGGRYVAVMDPGGTLRPRHMLTVRVTLRDSDGRAIDDAQISVDGGMPEHGHGLPTRPRVTASLGDGIYEIEGVRFNMGGWWELRLSIAASGGVDIVTFNLDL